MKKSNLMQKNISTQKSRQKKEKEWRKKIERRDMVGYQFILKKPSIGDIVCSTTTFLPNGMNCYDPFA